MGRGPLMIYMRDIENHQCRWIEDGGRVRNPLCCGESTHGHTSWCSKHYKKVFREDVSKATTQMDAAARYMSFTRKKKKY